MNFLNSLKLVILVIMLGFPSEKIPVNLLGHWSVGKPYNTPGPVGINAGQEKFIRRLHLVYIDDHLHVCGKEILVQPDSSKSLTENEFIQSYGFLPKIIGMKSSPITDLRLNPSNSMNACGEYQDPGTHLLMIPEATSLWKWRAIIFRWKKNKCSNRAKRKQFHLDANRL